MLHLFHFLYHFRNKYLFLIFIFFVSLGQSQTDLGFEKLKMGDHDNALTAFHQDTTHKVKKAATEYGLALIYIDTAFSNFDPANSWKHYLACYESMKTIKPKKKQKYIEKYNIKHAKLKRQILDTAIDLAIEKNTVEDLDNFLTVFKKAPTIYKSEATRERNRAAYEAALAVNTYDGFQQYIDKYQTSLKLRSKKLLHQSHLRLFEAYIKENGWKEIEDFSKAHPNNPYVLDSESDEFIKIRSSENLEVHRKFLSDHEDSLYKKFALDRIGALILKKGNGEDHNWFLFSFPDHAASKVLWKNYLKIYLAKNGKKSILDFANEFPQYPFAEELNFEKNKVEEIKIGVLLNGLKNSSDVNELLEFLEKYPSSVHAKEIDKKLISLLLKNPSVHHYEKYFALNRLPEEMPELLQNLYQIYAWDLNLDDINSFMDNWGDLLPDTTHVRKDRELAKQKIRLRLKSKWSDRNKKQYDEFIINAAPNYAAYQALSKMMSTDIENDNWSKALSMMETYKGVFKNRSIAFNQLYDAIKAEKQLVVTTKLDDIINTSGSEYSPVISADGNTLFFCAKFRLDNLGREDIYFSKKQNGNWSKAKLLNGINTSVHSEAPEAISADGTKMLLFKGGKLCYSDQTEEGWTSVNRLPSLINKMDWQADASISSNGKAILFTSQREDVVGNPDRNNLDIYVALRNEKGEWYKVLNLGAQVNTPRIDRSPYLHPDMKTLYFSSVGHGGFGGLDVFKTTRLDDTWTNWSTPVNLGKEINTTESDWGYKVSTDGSTAFFSYAEGGRNEDIFQIELPQAMRPEEVSTLAGVLLDSKGNPIEAEIVIEDLVTGKKVAELKSNPMTGEFFAVLPEKKKYSYYVKKENYYPISNNIDLSSNNKIDITNDLKMYAIEELASKGVSFTLENIFFDTDKYELKPASFQELDRLAELIRSNNFKVDLSGHTDNVGKAAYNQRLSKNRADAVRNYLIKKGISYNNIITNGLGESQPIQDNATDEGKAKNRRVEIRFRN